MKIKAAIFTDKQKTNYLSELCENKYTFLSFITIFLGLISGIIIFKLKKQQLDGSMWNLFITFFTDFSNKSSPEIISGLLITAIFYWALMFLSGCCLVGAPLIYSCTFVKSASISLLFSYMYNSYNMSGIEYTFLVLAPGKIIGIFGMLIMMNSCLKMNSSLKETAYNKAGECKTDFRRYLIVSTITAVIYMISELVNYLTIKNFTSLFTF